MNIIMEFRYYFIFLTNRKSFGDVKIFMNIILDFTGFDDVLLGVGNEKFMNINYFDFLQKKEINFLERKILQEMNNFINEREIFIILIESESVN